MKVWANNGWVTINVEYYGKANGRFGRDSFPGPNWGSMADGTVELNVKRAVKYFFDHNPASGGPTRRRESWPSGARPVGIGWSNGFLMGLDGVRRACCARAAGG